jgi:hypothetical protein
VKPSDLSGRLPALPPFGDSRAELRRTLRMHELGTAATLVVSWGISIIFSIALASGIFETLKSHETGEPPGVTVLGLVALCVVAWMPCSHYLWRCYRTGLRDVRKLHRQINRLEQFDVEFSRAYRPTRKRVTRGTVRAQEKQLGAPEQPTVHPEDDSAGNVVLIDSYRR